MSDDIIESIPYQKLVRTGQLIINIHNFISKKKDSNYYSSSKNKPPEILFPEMTKYDLNKWIYNKGADTYTKWEQLFNDWKASDNWSSIKTSLIMSIHSNTDTMTDKNHQYINSLIEVPLSFFRSFPQVEEVPRQLIKMTIVELFSHYLK